MFHGILFLPVLLSIVGPKTRQQPDEKVVSFVNAVNADNAAYHNEDAPVQSACTIFKDDITSSTGLYHQSSELKIDNELVADGQLVTQERFVNDTVYIIAYNTLDGSVVKDDGNSYDRIETDSGVEVEHSIETNSALEVHLHDAEEKQSKRAFIIRIDSSSNSDPHTGRSSKQRASLERVFDENEDNTAFEEISMHYMNALRQKVLELLPNLIIDIDK